MAPGKATHGREERALNLTADHSASKMTTFE